MCFPESFVFFYGQVEALADHGGGVKCSIEVGGNDFDDVFVGEEVCRRCCLFESDRAELGVEVALHPAGGVVVGLAVVVDHAQSVRGFAGTGVNQGIFRALGHVDVDLLTVNDVPAPFAVAFFYCQLDCHCAVPGSWWMNDKILRFSQINIQLFNFIVVFQYIVRLMEMGAPFLYYIS